MVTASKQMEVFTKNQKWEGGGGRNGASSTYGSLLI